MTVARTANLHSRDNLVNAHTMEYQMSYSVHGVKVKANLSMPETLF